MKIELKKFTSNERLSEETTAFAADLYIDGKNVGYAKNDGRGGCTEYHWHTAADREVVERAEAFCKTLPPHTYPSMLGNPPLTVNMDLEFYIDLLVEKELEKKAQKKLNKAMEYGIVMGVPGAASYRYVKYRVPLSRIPTAQLQAAVNQYKTQLRGQEQILNTNFEALGIVL